MSAPPSGNTCPDGVAAFESVDDGSRANRKLHCHVAYPKGLTLTLSALSSGGLTTQSRALVDVIPCGDISRQESCELRLGLLTLPDGARKPGPVKKAT